MNPNSVDAISYPDEGEFSTFSRKKLTEVSGT